MWKNEVTTLNKRQAKKAGKGVKRKKTARQLENLSAYRRERKRITNYLGRKRREGFDVGEVILPPIPDSPTKKDVDRLKRMTAEKLADKIYYINKITGEFSKASNREKTRRIRREFEEEANKTGQYVLYDPTVMIGEDYDDYVWDENVRSMKVIEGVMAEINRLNIQTSERRVASFFRDWIASSKSLDDVTDALEEAAKQGLRLNVNENYPDYVNASIEAKFFEDVLNLSSLSYDSEFMYDILNGYEMR